MNQHWTPATAYFIHCGSGCTCCNDEDELYGPFFDDKKAQESMGRLYEMGYRRSQYYPKGIYSLLAFEGHRSMAEGTDDEDNEQFLYDKDEDMALLFNRCHYFDHKKLPRWSGKVISSCGDKDLVHT